MSLRATARPAAALVALLSALVSLAPAWASDAAHATSARVSAAERTLPLRLDLFGVNPPAPQPGQRVRISVRLVNDSDRPARDVRVALLIGSALTTRSALEAFASGGDGEFGRQIPGTSRDLLATLPAGASRRFGLSVPVDQLSLGGAGVYPFGVSVSGSGPDGYAVLARLRTLLPYQPGGPGAAAPLRLAWLWPLADRPHRAASDVFRDDRLAGAFAPAGRLGRLVDVAVAAAQRPTPRATGARASAGAPSPVRVTWAVDPLLLEAARSMSDGYRVRRGSGTRAGRGQRAAAAWLARLRAAMPGSEVLALPYADVDTVALVRNGLTDDVATAVRRGRDVTRRLLATAAADDLAWPVDGLVTPAAATALADLGFAAFVLSDRALPTDPQTFYTPTARTQTRVEGRTVDVVVADSTLSSVVAAGAAGARRSPGALQRFRAETLLMSLELPGRQRSAVVAPDRRWDPPAGYAAALLADTGRLPWLVPATVGEIRAEPPGGEPRAALRYPPEAVPAELSAGYLDAVRRTGTDVAKVQAVVADPSARVLDGLRAGVLRSESSAWRSDLAAGESVRGAVEADAQATLGRVRVVSAGLVTLTGASGTLPVTVANELATPVTVTLRLDAGERLVLGSDGRFRQRIPPGQLVTVPVRASSRTSGVFPVRVWLATPVDGRRLGPVVTLYVRPTAYGTVALGITGGAFGMLLVAVAVRLVRRSSRRERAPTRGG